MWMMWNFRRFRCCSGDYIFYAERVYFVADGIFDWSDGAAAGCNLAVG